MPITFTVNHRQRPLEDLAKELSDFIKETDLDLPPRYAVIIKEPTKLIGQSIKQKFLNDDEDHDNFTKYLTIATKTKHIALNMKGRMKFILLI